MYNSETQDEGVGNSNNLIDQTTTHYMYIYDFITIPGEETQDETEAAEMSKILKKSTQPTPTDSSDTVSITGIKETEAAVMYKILESSSQPTSDSNYDSTNITLQNHSEAADITVTSKTSKQRLQFTVSAYRQYDLATASGANHQVHVTHKLLLFLLPIYDTLYFLYYM